MQCKHMQCFPRYSHCELFLACKYFLSKSFAFHTLCRRKLALSSKALQEWPEMKNTRQRKSAEKGEKKKRKIVAIVKEADDKKKKRLAFLTDTEGNVRSKEQEKETEKPRKNAQEKVVNRTKKVVNCGK